MYVAGEEITINWEIRSLTTKDVTQDLFDVIVIDGGGSATYYTNPTINWVEPTEDELGNITFLYTPGGPGNYEIKLVNGTSASHTVLDRIRFRAECDIPTYDPQLDLYAADTPLREMACAIPLNVVTTDWWWTQIVGITHHHSDPKKIVIIGRQDSQTGPLDIGIYEPSTDTMDLRQHVLEDALDTISNCTGLACNPSGRYATIRVDPIANNEYTGYWTDDFITWTRFSNPSYRFAGAGPIWYDDITKYWYWGSDIGMMTSGDGATWARATYIKLDESAPHEDYLEYNVPSISTFIPAGVLQDKDMTVMAGVNEEILTHKSKGSGGTLPASALQEWNPYYWGPEPPPLGRNLFLGSDVGFEDMTSHGSTVWFMGGFGSIAASVDNGEWPFGVANNTDARYPAGDLQEQSLSFFFIEYINGVLWACSGTGGPGAWWRSNNLGALSWTQDDNGPFGDTRLLGAAYGTPRIRPRNGVEDVKFAVMGYSDAEGPFKQKIIYSL